jgi:hypothetical protein
MERENGLERIQNQGKVSSGGSSHLWCIASTKAA